MKIVNDKLIIDLNEEHLKYLSNGYEPRLVWLRFSDVPTYNPDDTTILALDEELPF